jgi:membrane protease YdiL (CAAX protease family)
VAAMIFGSVVTSAIFALFHFSQNGSVLAPMVLIFGVSLVLCAVRLATRSLAASTLTHATYNFTLFLVMAVSTHGFQHLHHS